MKIVLILLKRKIKKSNLFFNLEKTFLFFYFICIVNGQVVDIGIHIFDNKNPPFWLKSNVRGLYKNGPLVSIKADDELKFLTYGIKALIPENNKPHLSQLFFKKNIYDFMLKFGFGGNINTNVLSSGSLVESFNAPPIPKVLLETDSFKGINFFKNHIFYKAIFAQGWFLNSGYVKDPMLHEKSLILKKEFSVDSFIRLELKHMVVWGGETKEFGPQPSTFNEFLKVFFALPGGRNSIHQEQENSLGNHLGSWKLIYRNKILEFYLEHPFEDESGARWFLNELDGLYGISFNPKKSKYISNITYEYITSLDQSGASAASDSTYGWDNYYNHYLYQLGWTNKGMVIGNPLFTLGSNVGRYGERQYIINNRLKAHHIGLKGSVSKDISFRVLLTYSENFGIYPDQYHFESNSKRYPFEGGLIQRSGLIELSNNNLFDNVSLSLAYSFDNGELLNKTDSFMLKINYKFKI